MKNLKYLVVLVALVTLFASCTKREFTPKLGDTPIEFPQSEIKVDLDGKYFYVPVQQTEQSATGAKAIMKVNGGTITLKDGSTMDYSDRAIFLTAEEIYLPAYDEETDGTDGLPTASFEFNMPQYKNYNKVELQVELVGENLGSQTTATVIVSRESEIAIEGTYEITSTAGEGGAMALTVTSSDGVYYVNPFGSDKEYEAERSGNNLTITLDPFTYQENPVIICAYHPADEGETVYLWPDENVILKFTATGFEITNGFFLGYDAGGGKWGSYFAALPGDKGTKK